MCALVLIAVQMAVVVPWQATAAVGVLAVVALPVSREFSRRVAIVLLTALGWAPALWLVPWPSGHLTRVGGVSAVLVGFLVGWVAPGPFRDRATRLVPRFRRVDAVAMGGVGFVLAYLWPLLRLRSPVDTMAVVLGGWDHVGHYDMTRMIVHESRLIPFIPPGSGGPYFYDSYPQGLHSALAALVELREGVGGGSGIGEVAAYLQATTLTYAATLAAVICCLCAVPAVRRQPGRAAWGVGGLLVAWLVSPGGGILHQAGYDNFVLAIAGVACLPMLLGGSGGGGRVAVSGPTVAASGAVMAVAQNWLLLLPMAGVAVVVALWPRRGRRWLASGRGRLAVGGLVGVTGVGVVAAGVQVLSARGADHLLAPGGFPAHNLVGYLIPIGAALAVAASVRGRQGWAAGGACVAVGAALLGWLAGTQIAATGQVGYYGFKALTAVFLIALTSLVFIAATAAPVRWRTARLGLSVPTAAVVISLVAASVLPLARQRADFPSVRVRSSWAAGGASEAGASTAMLQRMLATPVGTKAAFFLPGTSSDSGRVAQLNLWQLAIRGAWTQSAERCWQSTAKGSGVDADRLTDLSDSVAAARRVAGCGPAVLMVVPDDRVSLVRAALPAVAGQVLGWRATG